MDLDVLIFLKNRTPYLDYKSCSKRLFFSTYNPTKFFAKSGFNLYQKYWKWHNIIKLGQSERMKKEK